MTTIIREKVYEETFVSPFGNATKEEAEKALEKIRESHSASSGWEEIEGYAEQRSDGRWYAVRHHRKYDVESSKRFA